MRDDILMVRVFAVLCAAGIVSPTPALAYIDPLSGSIVLQALIAGVLGALFAMKQFGLGAKVMLRRLWRRFGGE